MTEGEMGNLNDVYISREQAIDAIEREFEDDIMGATKATEAVYSVDLADVSMKTAELMIENEKLKEQLSVIRDKAKAVHDAVTELDSEANL